MEHNTDIHRSLADYLYDDLTPEEAGMVEQQISSDPQWSGSYQLNRQVKDYLQAKLQLEEMRSDPHLEEARKLAEMAFEIGSPAESDLTPVRRSGRKRIRTLALLTAAASAIALLVAVGIVPSNLDQDLLFDRYYAPFEASDYTQRGNATQAYRDIALGINQYLEGNYGRSIEQFQSLAADPALQSEVNFFAGLSYLGLGQYPRAQDYLESLLDGDSRYQAEALWYLGLSYLKTGNYDQADKALAQLELYDGLYQKSAQSLRKKLRRLAP
jgi:hypothetical protein